jgi:hypothetical protein
MDVIWRCCNLPTLTKRGMTTLDLLFHRCFLHITNEPSHYRTARILARGIREILSKTRGKIWDPRHRSVCRMSSISCEEDVA